MKKVILWLGVLCIVGCSSKNLSPQEIELIDTLNFNSDLMSELKKETHTDVIQLPAISQETGEVLAEFYKGIHVLSTEEEAPLIVRKLKEKFRAKGYLLFVFNGEENFSVAAIKGTDELDILRYRRTDGINHDLENEDIVTKIAAWDASFGVTVIGCGRDWLELDFKGLPKDLDAFSKEVYEFCPDVVDQGVVEVKYLKMLIAKMHGVWLWWD